MNIPHRGNLGVRNSVITTVTVFKLNTACKDLVEAGICNYGVSGHEVAPRTGRVHWHIYLEVKDKVTAKRVKEMLKDRTAHIEMRKGFQQEAIDYCKKEGDWLEWGEPVQSQQGRHTDLEDVKRMIDEGADLVEVAEKHFGDFVRYHRRFMIYADLKNRKKQKQRDACKPTVIVYLGAAGSGKSHHCWNDERYRESGYKYLVQAENKVYFDGYEGEQHIWFDEFRGSVLPFGVFLQITDKWGCRVEIKGSSVEIFARKILITQSSGHELGGKEVPSFSQIQNNYSEDS